MRRDRVCGGKTGKQQNVCERKWKGGSWKGRGTGGRAGDGVGEKEEENEQEQILFKNT